MKKDNFFLIIADSKFKGERYPQNTQKNPHKNKCI